MSGKYKIATDMSLQLLQSIHADEHTISLALTFDVSPGCAETRPQPGEPASVSICTAHIVEGFGSGGERRFEAPGWLWSMIEGDEALEAEMLASAWQDEEAARDHHADMLREEQLLERRA